MPRHKEISGAQKRRLKVVADLRKVGSEPGQKKLCLTSNALSFTSETTAASTSSDSPPESDSKINGTVKAVEVEHSLPLPADAGRAVEYQVDELVLPVAVPTKSQLLQSVVDKDADVVHNKSTVSTQSNFAWPTNRTDKLHLLSTSPNQPAKNIPFQSDIYFQTNEEDGDDQRIQRKWLMFDSDKMRLYCTVCGCYSTNRLNKLVLRFFG